MFSHNVGDCLPTRMLGVMAAVALFGAPLASAETSSSRRRLDIR